VTLPAFCPQDGSELAADEAGTSVERRICPECQDRWYGSGYAQLYWRVPPAYRERARSLVERGDSVSSRPWLPSKYKAAAIPLGGVAALLAAPLLSGSAQVVTIGFGFFLLSFWITFQFTLTLHEQIHHYAFETLGVSSRIEYIPLRVLGIPLGRRGGRTIPEPMSWRGDEWEQALVALAPLVMLVPVLSVVVFVSLQPFELGVWERAIFLGEVFGAGFSALPSHADIAIAFGTERYRAFTDAEAAPTHRLAEGI